MTSKAAVVDKRRYDDACSTALALEVIGERWSLLVMRELMFGPRRFSEIRANLPGVSANVLTQRLEALEAAGVLVRRRLATSATVQAYELTPWGREAAPIMAAMGRWATRSSRYDPTLFLSPASAMLSLNTMIDRARLGDMRAAIAFRFPGDAFVAGIADGDIAIRRGETAGPHLSFIGATSALAAAVYGKVPFDALAAAGQLVIEGDRALAQRFVDLFALPEKIA